jgi:hypothetical protein
MKVGDLVKCPAFQSRPGYFGVVISVSGHKAEILGGNVVSWDGILGRYTWDICDIHLVRDRNEVS